MGKGDKKTRRGKISRGSYGVLRPRQKSTPEITAVKKPKEEPKVALTEASTKEPTVVKIAEKPTTKATTATAPKKKTTAKKTVASEK